MQRWFANVYHLGLKELTSLGADVVLVIFTVYWFSFMIYSEATGVETEVRRANIAIVDNDQSQLSHRIRDALRPPQFKPVVLIDRAQVDPLMDQGRYTFVLDIPPHFEAEVLRGASPRLQLNVDATAVAQAGVGASYIEEIVSGEIETYLAAAPQPANPPIRIVTRAHFNPNLESIWFQSIASLIEKITLVSIMLVGAAVIREREQGTIEHLLVMPLRASEIAAAKIWSNGLVVLAGSALSLAFVIRLALGVPIEGSVALFLFGTAAYLFATTALGLLLATLANTMPQFGLLLTIIFIIITLLSGAMSPLERMPGALQLALQVSPAVHYVQLAQGVLYRAAGIDIVWPQLIALFALGGLFTTVSLARFRAMLSEGRA